MVAAIVALLALDARAAKAPEAPYLFVRNTDTGEVLYSHRSTHPRPIASVTKLMSAMVLLDEEPDLEQTVTLGEIHMLDPIGWKTPWEPGLTVQLGELLVFALASSDNIAMTTVVEESGLPLEVFVERMNDKAEALGMMESTFGNVTGLDDRNTSTAEDVARMVEAAMTYPEIRDACAATEAVARVPELDRPVRSGVTDRLLFDPFWTILAAKTGYTRLSGYCFAAVADAATGQRLTMVFLGLDRDGKRFRMAGRLKALLLEQGASPGGDP